MGNARTIRKKMNKPLIVGAVVFLIGVGMFFFDATKLIAGFPVGFGLAQLAKGADKK